MSEIRTKRPDFRRICPDFRQNVWNPDDLGTGQKKTRRNLDVWISDSHCMYMYKQWEVFVLGFNMLHHSQYGNGPLIKRQMQIHIWFGRHNRPSFNLMKMWITKEIITTSASSPWNLSTVDRVQKSFEFEFHWKNTMFACVNKRVLSPNF